LSALRPLLARFDAALEKTPGWSLSGAAEASIVERCQRTLGVALPASLRTLYAWHDGETPGATLFETLLREELEVLEEIAPSPLLARFMPLAEVGRTGIVAAHLDQDGECVLGRPAADGVEIFHVIPFVWLRADADLPERADATEPEDGDWLLGIDTRGEAVWLLEAVGEGLVFSHAPSLVRWIGGVVERLERTARSKPPPSVRPPPKVAAPAVQLVSLLVEKKLVELAEGVTVADVAERIAPLLALVPEKRAMTAVVELFFDDPNIDEVFADEDTLRAITREFLG
jgi:hypothetical protein